MKKYILLYFLLLISSAILSQQNPSSLKWFEINAKHTKVVFPEGLEKQAQKTANLIDYLYNIENKTLKAEPKKIPLLLYSRSVTSNGFVGLRPWRSAWYITPSQYAADLTTEDWFYTLGSHEFRHAVQMEKSNRHFTKLLSILFGQTGTLMGQYSYPYWYFEGDAVCMETGLSDMGRGRIPQFDMGIRTILLNDIKIKYDKAKFRSYKTFYPGHYNLGWLLTSYARIKYGADIWDKTIETSSKYSFWPYAFSLALKKHTGLNEKKLYDEAMNYYDSVWTENSKKIKGHDVKIINKEKKKSWTKYTEPNYIENNHILVKKSSMKSDITSFYLLDENGNEYKIKATDAGIVSTAKGKAVWARTYPDLRWQLQSYSDIIVFDYRTYEEKRLTEKKKFFAPAISPDGKIIATVEYNEKMQCALVFLDAETGKEIKRLNAENNDFFRTPAWNNESRKVIFTKSNEYGTILSIFDFEKEKLTDIGNRTYENIGRPVFYKNYIIYNSPYDGTGNIYAVNIKTEKRFRITDAKYGCYNPRIKDDKMLFINYSAEGYDIAETQLKPETWTELKDVKYKGLNVADIIQKQEQGKNILNPEIIPDKKYEIKKYNRLKDAVNIHSWGIYTTPPDEISPDGILNYRPEIALEIYSANILNTVYGSLGGRYNINEQTFSTEMSAIFKKYYPEFSVSGRFAERSLEYPNAGIDEWNEISSSFTTSVPFNFSSGVFYKGANLKTSYSFIQRKNKDYRYLSESGEGNFSSLSYSGYLYAFRHTATQDINPKTGYFLYASYQHTPFNDDIYGNQFSVLSSFYLPGFFRHHSFNFKLGYEKQRQDFDNYDYYWFNTPQSFARGYDFRAFTEYFSFKTDYEFPVWYPDFNIGPFVYFKRIRGGLFYDYSKLNILGYDDTESYMSAGAEMYLQMYLFRLSEPVEIGGRVSYLLDGSNTFVPEFIALSIPF